MSTQDKSISFGDLTFGISNANEADEILKKQQNSEKLSQGINLKPKSLDDERKIRSIAYDSVCKSLNKWDSVVDLYKSTPNLEYPIFKKDNRLTSLSSSNRPKFSQSNKTELQLKMDQLLGKDLQTSNTKSTFDSSKESNLLKSSLDEAKQYQTQIARFKTKMREMGRKNLLHRKVKSKRFRKISRLANFKSQYHTEDSLKEIIEKADVERAKERLTLKHVGKSKAMKRKVMYGKYDPRVRSQMDEMKLKGKSILDNKSSLRGLIISDEALKSSENESNEEMEVVTEDELQENTDNDEFKADNSNLKSSGWFEKVKTSSNNLENDTTTDNTAQINFSKSSKKHQPSISIAEAFQSDDIVAHFETEKQKELEKDRETLKDKDNFLPGWGRWSGPGIRNEISEVKKAKYIEKTPKGAFKRKDGQLKHVIINEDAERPIRKYQVSKLPYPYTNIKDFENSISTPLGSDWNTPQSFQTLNAPKISIKKGSVVTPLKSSDVFKTNINSI